MKAAQIVLVEDNPADVFLVRLALEEGGISHELVEFENGGDAVRALCAPVGAAPVPDAILLDLNTPRTDGLEALQQLKNCPRLSGVPIAVLTSSRAQSDRQRATILGARFIEKPCQLQEFLSCIGREVKAMLS